MNKERFFRVIGQIDDRVLARYYQMDERLARRQNARRAATRMLTAAACFVLMLILCMPLAALAHPVGQAVLAGDFETLAEQLYELEGYEPWREQTVERLEQLLPEGISQRLWNTPIFDALMRPRYPDLGAEEIFEDGEPYHLYFLSNGDGTCSLKYITTDPNFEGDFVLEIPETSPKGDVVTAIDIGQATRVKRSPHADFPYVLTASAMNELIQTAQNNDISAFDASKLTAYYLKLSANNLDEKSYQALVDAFPIAALGDIYVFDTNAGVAELEKIYSYLTEYCGWNQEMYLQSVEEVVALAKQSKSRERVELALTVLHTADLRGVVELVIPSTVSSINSSMWSVMTGLETVTIAKENPTLRMIGGCLVNVETGTLLLYLRDDGGFPEDANLLTLDSYAFVLSRLQPNVEGAQNQVDLHLPESVIEIKDNCFAGMDAAYEWTVNIYLPESLRYFGREAQDKSYEKWIYHYPGTMQEWESDVVFGEAAKVDFIYLLTEDAEEPVKFFFPAK